MQYRLFCNGRCTTKVANAVGIGNVSWDENKR